MTCAKKYLGGFQGRAGMELSQYYHSMNTKVFWQKPPIGAVNYEGSDIVRKWYVISPKDDDDDARNSIFLKKPLIYVGIPMYVVRT